MIVATKGLIGSGKSTISLLLADICDAYIFNCDMYVSQLYKNDSELITKINETFNLSGTEVDKKLLGEIVFNDVNKLKLLESIVLPIVEQKINSIDAKNIILDCPTIDKLNNIDVDVFVVCTASYDTLVKRVSERDGRTKEQIDNIIKVQDTGYIANVRTYSVNTEQDEQAIIEVLEHIVGSVYASKNWKNS